MANGDDLLPPSGPPLPLVDLDPSMPPEVLVEKVRVLAATEAAELAETSQYSHYSNSSRRRSVSGMLIGYRRFFGDYPAGKGPDYATYSQQVREGMAQKAEQATWCRLIESAPSTEAVQGLLGGYALWIGQTRKYPYYPPGDIQSTLLIRATADWMETHDLAITPSSPIAITLAELFTNNAVNHAPGTSHARVVQGIQAVARKGAYEKVPSSPLEAHTRLAQAVIERPPYYRDDPFRRALHELTGRVGVDFDVDGTTLDAYIDKTHQLLELNGRGIAKTMEWFDYESLQLISDTLALIAASGGDYAAKIWRNLEQSRQAASLASGAKMLTAPAVVAVANVLTAQINAAQSLRGPNEEVVELDQLERTIDYLPEAFRRILYVAIDLDESLQDKAAVVIKLDIEDRVKALMNYAEMRHSRTMNKRVIGTVAVTSDPHTGEPRPSGYKPQRAGPN